MYIKIKSVKRAIRANNTALVINIYLYVFLLPVYSFYVCMSDKFVFFFNLSTIRKLFTFRLCKCFYFRRCASPRFWLYCAFVLIKSMGNSSLIAWSFRLYLLQRQLFPFRIQPPKDPWDSGQAWEHSAAGKQAFER